MILNHVILFTGKRGKVKGWVLRHREGNILYNTSTGHIEVKKTGYYFIYSQMFYSDAPFTVMTHATLINDEKVMGSFGVANNGKRMLNTKYHGGVFFLRENDTISVVSALRGTYIMTSQGESFFGAFRLGRGTQGKQM